MDFDPAVIGYTELLDLFWKSHRPTAPAWSRQYRAAVFFHDERQRALAEAGRARAAERLGAEIHTAIEPLRAFHRAEDYHQKHRLRQRPALLTELEALYPDARALTDAPAAAKLNAYLDGHLDREALAAALADLPEAARARLLQAAERS